MTNLLHPATLPSRCPERCACGGQCVLEAGHYPPECHQHRAREPVARTRDRRGWSGYAAGPTTHAWTNHSVVATWTV